MNADKNYLKRIAEYEKHEEILMFEHFSKSDALAVGLLLIEHAKEHNFSVAIEITVNDYQVFKYGFEGATKDNDKWMARKRNAVNLKNKSSMLLGVIKESEGKDLQRDYRLNPDEYAFHGGGFPIRLKSTGVIGTICVSGRPQEQDHQMIVDVLCKYLGKEID